MKQYLISEEEKAVIISALEVVLVGKNIQKVLKSKKPVDTLNRDNVGEIIRTELYESEDMERREEEIVDQNLRACHRRY